MEPLALALQASQALADYLSATFSVGPSSPFAGLFDPLLSPGPMVKGPYVQLRRPFLQEAGDHGLASVPPHFVPYRHQLLAWRRLAGPHPRPTLVATGTGSGKTECFLYPIYDHILANPKKAGIKAIIIYPMNALATDQAGRMAHDIATNPALAGRVTVGLYVGAEPGYKTSDRMTETSVITDRQLMLRQSPDILLTNYKMLDRILLDPKHFPLLDRQDPGTLKYLVVDEIHSFDGAQGADLAGLILRLRHRLGDTSNTLSYVGTSATVGSDPTPLLDFASRLFSLPSLASDGDAVIGESYVSAADFLGPPPAPHRSPSPQLALLSAAVALPQPGDFKSSDDYIQALARVWGLEGGVDDWGDQLKALGLFRRLVTSYGDAIWDLSTAAANPSLWGLAANEPLEPERARQVLAGLLALIGASTGRDSAGRSTALMNLQVQLWVRELSRLVASVGPAPRLAFHDDLTSDADSHLPVSHCRDCNTMGWVAVRTGRGEGRPLKTAPKTIYNHFFNRLPGLFFIYPLEAGEVGADSLGAYAVGAVAADEQLSLGLGADFEIRKLCSHCMQLSSPQVERCPCGSVVPGSFLTVAVTQPEEYNGETGQLRSTTDCPHCKSSTGLTIVGARSTTLASTLTSSLYSSPLNDDKRLIAFSDSVQDASHLGGYLGANTFRISFRAALARFLAQNPHQDLASLAPSFCRHYLDQLGPQGFFAQFVDPYIAHIPPIAALLDADQGDSLGKKEQDRQKQLLDRSLPFITERLSWLIFEEATYRSHIGRTLARTQVAVLFPVQEAMDQGADHSYQRLLGQLGGYNAVSSVEHRAMVYALVRLMVRRGGIWTSHTAPYFDSGNNYALGFPKDSPAHQVIPHGRRGARPKPIIQKSRSGASDFDPIPVDGGPTQSDMAKIITSHLAPLENPADYQGQVMALVLASLAASGLVRSGSGPSGDLVWALRSEALYFHADPVARSCASRHCGTPALVPGFYPPGPRFCPRAMPRLRPPGL